MTEVSVHTEYNARKPEVNVLVPFESILSGSVGAILSGEVGMSVRQHRHLQEVIDKDMESFQIVNSIPLSTQIICQPRFDLSMKSI